MTDSFLHLVPPPIPPPSPEWCPCCAFAHTCERCAPDTRIATRCLCRNPEHDPDCLASPAALPPPVARKVNTGSSRRAWLVDGLPVQAWCLEASERKGINPSSSTSVDNRPSDVKLTISKGPRLPSAPLPEPKEVIVIDTETTGNRVGTDRMIELACAVCVLPVFGQATPPTESPDNSPEAIGFRDPSINASGNTISDPPATVMLDPGHLGKIFVTKIHPGVNPYTGKQIPIHFMASKIHGYYDRDVANAPPVDEIMPKFLAWAKGRPIVAHNASFDVGMLRDGMDRSAIPYEHLPVYDTLKIARSHLPGLPNHKLGTLAAHYGIDTGRAHRAGSDVATLAGVLLAMLREAGKGIAEMYGEAERL